MARLSAQALLNGFHELFPVQTSLSEMETTKCACAGVVQATWRRRHESAGAFASSSGTDKRLFKAVSYTHLTLPTTPYV